MACFSFSDTSGSCIHNTQSGYPLLAHSLALRSLVSYLIVDNDFRTERLDKLVLAWGSSGGDSEAG